MVTLNTHHRSQSFSDPEVVGQCRKALIQAAAEYRFAILAYCFMPDHLHLLVQGRDDASRLVPFMQRFKQTSGYRFKAQRGQPLWQRSFYDHVLRGEEDMQDVAEYIWNNPIRAGLADERDGYPFWGPRGQT